MTIDREMQILIVGGGLGGLVTARLLTEIGLDPLVVERNETVSDDHGPIELWPDTMTLLSWVDLADTIHEAGTAVRSWSCRTNDGTIDQSFETDALGVLSLRYGALRETLQTNLPNDILRTDTAVRGIDDTEESVTVVFDNGVSEPFDAVVGADGPRSTVRDLLDRSVSHRHETTSFAFPLDPPVGINGATEQWTTHGALLRVLPTDEQPWGVLTLPPNACNGSPATRETIVEYTDEIEWLPLDTLPETPDAYNRRRDLRINGTDVTGTRVALLGDAAHTYHPITGVGPTLALEDAVILATTMTDSRLPIPERIAAYTNCRKVQIEQQEWVNETAQSYVDSTDLSHSLQKAAAVRYARLRSSFSETPPTPSVERSSFHS